MFSRVAIPFYIPTSNGWEFQTLKQKWVTDDESTVVSWVGTEHSNKQSERRKKTRILCRKIKAEIPML